MRLCNLVLERFSCWVTFDFGGCCLFVLICVWNLLIWVSLCLLGVCDCLLAGCCFLLAVCLLLLEFGY